MDRNVTEGIEKTRNDDNVNPLVNDEVEMKR